MRPSRLSIARAATGRHSPSRFFATLFCYTFLRHSRRRVRGAPRMEKKNTDLSASEQARLLDDIKLLQEVSAAISEQVDDDALYERLIDGAARIMHSDFASMHMLNAEGGQPGNLRLLACRGLNSRANKFWAWVPADGEGSCAHALLTGTRVIVPDVEAYD